MSIKVKDALGKKIRNYNWNLPEWVEVVLIGNRKAFIRDSEGCEDSCDLDTEYDELYQEPELEKKECNCGFTGEAIPPEKSPSDRIQDIYLRISRFDKDEFLKQWHFCGAIIQFLDEQWREGKKK